MLKEQVIALNLDLEDKAKVEQLLRRKLELEKSALVKIEEEIKERYQALTQKELAEFEEQRSSLTAKSQELLASKSALLQQCQELVEDIKENEREIAGEGRRLVRQTDEAIEQERKRWKMGFEERLQKFLGAKAAEYKDHTNRALQPEINRLESIHKQDMKDMEEDFRERERKLKDTFQQKRKSMEEEEKVETERELTMSKRSLQTRHTHELDTLNNDHKRAMQDALKEAEKDAERVRNRATDKMRRLRDQQYEDMKDMQEKHQAHLVDMKRKHSEKLEELQSQHKKKLQQLKEEENQALQDLEGELKSYQQKSAGMGDSDSDEAPRSPLKAGKSVLGAYSSPSRGGASKKDDADLPLPLALQAVLEENASQLQVQRDKDIQAEIRLQESELVKLERDLKRKTEVEIRDLKLIHEKEEEQLKIRNAQLLEEVNDLIVQKEQQHKVVSSYTQQEDKLLQEIGQLQRDVQVYADGIEVYRTRLRDKEEAQRRQQREMQLHYAPILRQLKEDCEKLEKEIKATEETWLQDMNEKEKLHAQELSRLDSTVKSEVAKREEELAMLKETLDEELVKKSKLTAMVHHYTNPTAQSEEIAKARSGTRDREKEREAGWVGSAGVLNRKGHGSVRAAEGINADQETVRSSRTGTSTLRFGSVTTNTTSGRLSRK